MSRRFVIAKTGESWSKPGVRLESHDTLEAAEHALEIVNAHEQRNGRGEDYWSILDWRAEGLCEIFIKNEPMFIIPKYKRKLT